MVEFCGYKARENKERKGGGRDKKGPREGVTEPGRETIQRGAKFVPLFLLKETEAFGAISLVSQRRPQRRKQVTQGAPPPPLTTELTDKEEKAEDAGDGDWKRGKLNPDTKKTRETVRKKKNQRGRRKLGETRTQKQKARDRGDEQKNPKELEEKTDANQTNNKKPRGRQGQVETEEREGKVPS